MGYRSVLTYNMLLLLVALVLSAAMAVAQEHAPACDPVPGPGSFARYVGTNACVYCHKDGHNFAQHGAAGKEYSIWVSRDPHSCAYNTLLREKSVLIGKKLKLKVPPHKNELCLNCHATNVPQELMACDSEQNLADGVSCESCHGAAEHWLVPHKFADWKYKSPQEKELLGFTNTDNLATRARTCVQCHVGSPGRDVNHDLIAAGHPRLYFEMSAYHAKMPRHWSRVQDLNINSPTAEARLWLVGQFVSAAAAVRLLEHRARNTEKPWPEFAEYACFSCHHDLASKGLTDGQDFFGSGLGQPKWNVWHLSGPEQLMAELERPSELNVSEQIDLIRSEMQKAVPDRMVASESLSELANGLDQIADWLGQPGVDSVDAIALAGQVVSSDDADKREMNWDRLTQRYLAAIALRQAILDSGQARFDFDTSRAKLLQVRDLIKFVEDYNGPPKLDVEAEQTINQCFGEIFGGH